MAINDVVARHLLEARAELLEQRRLIDSDVQALDRMLVERGVSVREGSETPTAASPGPGMFFGRGTLSVGGGPLTTREAIVRVLNSDLRDWQLPEIIHAVLDLGVDAQESSIRSVVSRVVREGQAAKGTSGRSSYRAAPDPTDADAASVSAEAASDRLDLRPEGGSDVSSETRLESHRDDI